MGMFWALVLMGEIASACTGVDLAITDVRAYQVATPSQSGSWQSTPGGLTLSDVEIVVSYVAKGLPNDKRYFIDYFEGLPYAPWPGLLGMNAAIRVGSGGIIPNAFRYGDHSSFPEGTWVDIIIDTENTVVECDETNNVFSVFIPLATACDQQDSPGWVCLNGYEP
jgi:hypothetical protein